MKAISTTTTWTINIFTKDIITIIFVILLGSLFYLVITIIETYYRFLSYKKNYDDLKESYRDILDEQDIVTIFKNDKEYLKNKKNVKKITVIFSILWVTLVIIAFISMVLNYNSEYIKKVIDILYKIVKCIWLTETRSRIFLSYTLCFIF